MGAGYYGIPPEVSARVMVHALKARLTGETTLREITICVLDTRQYEAVRAALAAVS
jgi:O-acetyl-ADP-ribose deacetylase (regulator of RNase III)